MMINKRLIQTVSQSKKYIVANVALQWLSLAANICSMIAITKFLEGLFYQTLSQKQLFITFAVIFIAVFIRFRRRT